MYENNCDDYLNERCRTFNSMVGTLDKNDSYHCSCCHNKGVVWTVRNDEIVECSCPECFNVRRSLKLLKNSGLSELSFDNYNISYSWQKTVFDTVYKFAENSNGQWLYIGGQSGSGKTHLCTAALRHLIYSCQRQAVLMKWAEVSKELKGIINESAYSEKMEYYKNADILYIDDFLKVKKGEYIKPADINLAFELIDHRYCSKLTTIISSEFSLDEIITADEATGSRIKQMTGSYALNIIPDIRKNYRLR